MWGLRVQGSWVFGGVRVAGSRVYIALLRRPSQQEATIWSMPTCASSLVQGDAAGELGGS